MRLPLPISPLAALLALVLTAAPACAQERVGSVMTEAGPIAVENLADGIDHPWGMAFLPDRRLLVTDKDDGNVWRLTPLQQDSP